MKVALIGNPNSGKTSLFNKLTGLNQKVGNWPGVTIEKKEGKILRTEIQIVDLPGVYSLSPFSDEEKVSREYLLNEKPDLVINVIDSTMLERSLYLTTQLLDIGVNIAIALNMNDLLEKKGIELDEVKLSKELGVSVVKVSARSGYGIGELVELVSKFSHQKCFKNLEIYSKVLENELNFVQNEFNLDNKFLAVETLIEPNGVINNRSSLVLEKLYKMDVAQVVVSQKYDFISSVRDKCLKTQNKRETISDKLDKVFLNRWLALPIFAVLMSLVYVFAVGVVGKTAGEMISNWVKAFSVFVQKTLFKLGASNWAVSLVVNGVIAGAGSVLSFVPELIVIFFCIIILETTGYMARVSFVFDRLFRSFGLSGKSLVPFIVGTGCSVPAISLAKTIENKAEREMTAICTPFVPCSAKLPIISLFAGFFFPNNSGLVTASLYFLSIAMILLSCLIMKKLFYKNKVSSFVLELPEYKLPSVKYVSRDVFDKTKDFVSRAGTIIVFCSIIVWFLSSFSWSFRFGCKIEDSILAWLGNCFSWFFYPIIGEMNWAVSVSAIQGLIAKEQVVSSMSVIAGLSQDGAITSVFSSKIFSSFSKVGAFSFVVFNLFSAPCVASIGAMKNELKSTKKTIFVLLFQIGIAWVVSSLFFLLGSWLR